ncbi:NUDIX hydrolase [Frateuria sp. Soil773]|uniref:NUDIX hydrolase n=1 Tax=Frateuria sp. Soil773 TaxID=1736407 RepID=UPI0012F83E51|nr:NUDIX hydrolase [Frateuria sp. Soil773]
MKAIACIVMWVLAVLLPVAGRAADQPRSYDNYTIQRLILLNDKNEILLEKHPAGWMTPSLRSNREVSTLAALDDLAEKMGVSITQPRLAAIYLYIFDGLPDHKGASFRQHYVAHLKSGTVRQTEKDQAGPAERRWVSLAQARELIDMDPLKRETFQVLDHPEKLWGATYVLKFKDDKMQEIEVAEDFYPLGDQ